MAELVSKRYALALFEAGDELEKIDVFKDELTLLKGLFENEDRFLEVLSHPRINKTEKKEMIDKILKGKISEEMLNFLYILIDKRREKNIIDITDEYEELYNKHNNIIKVVAKTAVPMEEKAKEKLISVLSEKLNKTIELTNPVDEKLMGGVLLQIEDRLIDGSLKGQLEDIGKVIVGSAN